MGEYSVQLASRDKQRQRIWKAFELTGDEDSFKKGIATLGNEVRDLQEQRRVIEERVASNANLDLTAEDISKACELIAANMKGLTFEDKRFILDVLQVKGWIDGTDVYIKGAIPLQNQPVVSAQSPSARRNMQTSVPFQVTASVNW